MMPHKLVYISVLALSLMSCSNSGDATAAEIKKTEDAATRDARIVLDAPEASMARQKAILAIRARETRLRDCGFEYCADVYISTAAEILGFPLDTLSTTNP